MFIVSFNWSTETFDSLDLRLFNIWICSKTGFYDPFHHHADANILYSARLEASVLSAAMNFFQPDAEVWNLNAPSNG